MLCRSSKKVAVCFTIISNLAVATRASVNNVRADLFLKFSFIVPMLEPLTTDQYTIKDSFTFAEEIQSFVSKLVIVSFDMESLITNIPLQETLDLCVENLFKDKAHVDNLLKDFFHELFTRTMSESLILFDQEFYKQHDGVAMGSPLGPTLTNVLLCYHEKLQLQNCPSEFKPATFSLETSHRKFSKLFKLST